jgi:P-type Ca2+ transporter type 2C
MAVAGTYTTGSTTSIVPGREMYYIKGSIDTILSRCRFYHVAEDSTPALDSNTRSVILNKAQGAASRGLRVIAMAYGYGTADGIASVSSSSRASSPSSSGHVDKEKAAHLVFAGYAAMFDPPRKGVADAIALLQSGGVQVVMITGDAEETALSIAKTLGIRGSTNRNACLTGVDLDQLGAAQLCERVGNVTVFARTSPKHKMAIVEAFQARGAVVAMTGDGGEYGHRSPTLWSALCLIFLVCSERCAGAEDGGYWPIDGQERDGRRQRICRCHPGR